MQDGVPGTQVVGRVDAANDGLYTTNTGHFGAVDRSLANPSSYASFAAHVANNGDPPIRFGLGPGARRL